MNVDLKKIKAIQKEIRELYWLACNGDQTVPALLEALDYRIECEFFGYDGD